MVCGDGECSRMSKVGEFTLASQVLFDHMLNKDEDDSDYEDPGGKDYYSHWRLVSVYYLCLFR